MFKKLSLILLFLFSNFLTTSIVAAGETTLHFVRPADLKTAGQGVKLYVDKKYIGKVWHNRYAVVKSTTGKHKLMTKVGLSIGVPVTGLAGAKKFKSKVSFNKNDLIKKFKDLMHLRDENINQLIPNKYKDLLI